MEQNSLEQKIQAKEIAQIFPLNFQLKIVVVLEQSRWKTWIFEPRQDANVVKTMAFSNPHLHLDSKRKLSNITQFNKQNE